MYRIKCTCTQNEPSKCNFSPITEKQYPLGIPESLSLEYGKCAKTNMDNSHYCTCWKDATTCRASSGLHMCKCIIDPEMCRMDETFSAYSHECICMELQKRKKISILCKAYADNHVCICEVKTHGNCMSLYHVK